MKKRKNKGYELLGGPLVEPQDRYLKYECDGDSIWLKAPYLKGSDMSAYSLIFVYKEKKYKINFITNGWVFEIPQEGETVVSADYAKNSLF